MDFDPELENEVPDSLETASTTLVEEGTALIEESQALYKRGKRLVLLGEKLNELYTDDSASEQGNTGYEQTMSRSKITTSNGNKDGKRQKKS